MSSQEKLQLTEEAVMMHGLSGVHSEVALLLWANRHHQLMHPLVETRLSEIRSIQMTPVDESILYHAESFNKESETVASDFSDADEEELYHTQSQEQQGPAPPASPKVRDQFQTGIDQTTRAQTPPASPRANEGIGNVETATDDRLEAPTLNPVTLTTGFEDNEEPPVLEGSDNTVILPEPLLTDSEFDDFFNAPVSLEQDKTCMDAVLGLTQTDAARQDGVPPSNILRDAVVAAGLQLEWNSSQEDPTCSNALSEFPTPTPPSPAPISQKYLQGDIQSAIKHLRTVSELRQWSDEWNVPEDPRILRALADLGDTDAFLLLQLLGMTDMQTLRNLQTPTV